MSKINSKIKYNFKVLLLLSCFVGHPVIKSGCYKKKEMIEIKWGVRI